MTNDMHTILPRQPVPALRLPLQGGGEFDLAGERSSSMTLLVFYRGVHCPQCRLQLTDLEAKLGDFAERGVGVVAISADPLERAEEARSAWGLERLRLAHSLPLREARRWGLFVSRSRGRTSSGHEEPTLFNEPGMFLVRPDGTLYSSSIQTTPFARPKFDDVLRALDFIAKNDYPPRGDVERV